MGKWRHHKESKEYRNLEKIECRKCHHKGRDVKIRPNHKGLFCKNCA